MENDIKQYIKQQNEDLFNNKFDIKNINELNQNENIYNLNIKEKNPENLSIFDKYKLQNLDSINNETKEDNDIKIKDKISKCKVNSLEQDLKIKNDNYTNQINEIISKNFKNGLDSSQNIYFNTYLNNEKKNKYLELDRERKLLLLKNIELEKEINNLNNFVDIGNKLPQNKILNNIRLKKNNIESYNNKVRNKKIIKDDKNYKKEIKQAQNVINILDKRINNLKEEINENYALNNNKYKEKIKEVKIWRETFHEELYKYKNLLKDLKENLNNDKIIYKDVITKMKKKATENINNIYNNYKNQIIENNKKLNFLRSENEKLNKKENKVKEIFLYNFK